MCHPNKKLVLMPAYVGFGSFVFAYFINNLTLAMYELFIFSIIGAKHISDFQQKTCVIKKGVLSSSAEYLFWWCYQEDRTINIFYHLTYILSNNFLQNRKTVFNTINSKRPYDLLIQIMRCAQHTNVVVFDF